MAEDVVRTHTRCFSLTVPGNDTEENSDEKPPPAPSQSLLSGRVMRHH